METSPSDKADLWRRRIEAQLASGQSVRAWCLGSGTREHSFYWWRMKLGLSPAPRQRRRRRESSEPSVALARVRVVDSVVREPLHLRLTNGRELILPASMPMQRVVELLLEMEKQS